MAAGLAFLLYGYTAAPGLTWANYGADGGDLLAAALANGTPHPTGYPLYTLLLQGWLALLNICLPGSDLAWRGNLFSALAASLSVGLTVHVVRHLWPRRETSLLPALVAAAAWMTAPLLWGQAIITEVYALHGLLCIGFFWATVVYRPRQPETRGLLLGALLGLGAAHHVTIGLLVPGVLYWLWRAEEQPMRRPRFWLLLAAGLLPGLLLYSRFTLTAPGAPVNWAGDGSAQDIWWLVSGAAYRRYLFALPPGEVLTKTARWALTITSQFTPFGLALCLAGLYRWDRVAGRLRSLSLLWVLPVSLYAISYHTADSEVYLLPVVWLMAVWLPFGVEEVAEWITARRPQAGWARMALGASLVGLILLTGLRLPAFSLAGDGTARQFVAEAVRVAEPGSIIFSSADAETFALWYAAWGSGELLEAAPGTALVNVALLQFGWYRALLHRIYPNLAGVETGEAGAILQANAGQRPIFFSEIVPPAQADQLQPVGSLWRYSP
ncbi:MAG: DUF2723 domain-containing protein [Caldilineaceae bacterium]